MPIVTWILGLTSNQTQNRKFHLKSIIKILISRYTNDREVIIKILRIGNLQEYLKIPLDNHHKFFWYSQTVLKITLQQAYIFSILWMSTTKVILLSASRSRSKIYFICHLFWIFQESVIWQKMAKWFVDTTFWNVVSQIVILWLRILNSFKK